MKSKKQTGFATLWCSIFGVAIIVATPSISLGAPTAESGMCIAQPAAKLPSGNVLFTDSFDQHADWTGNELYVVQRNPWINGGVPGEWWAGRSSPYWAPSLGDAGTHENMEILAVNSDKARGGVGKSAVFWRKHYTDYWGNDKGLYEKLEPRQNSVYVEMYVQFDPAWKPSGLAKFLRVYAWDEDNSPDGPFKYFHEGQSGPMFIWDYGYSDTYGVYNFVAFRGGPYGENYYGIPTPEGLPRALVRGDASLDFTNNLIGMAEGGTNPDIRSKDTDAPDFGDPMITINRKETHADIFGPLAEKQWTKVAVYVSMNSAPGIADGKLVQWFDDERVLFNDKVAWIGETKTDISKVKWNIVGIGGNEHLSVSEMDRIGLVDADQFEAYYAIDDVLIRDSVPVGLSIAP